MVVVLKSAPPSIGSQAISWWPPCQTDRNGAMALPQATLISAAIDEQQKIRIVPPISDIREGRAVRING